MGLKEILFGKGSEISPAPPRQLGRSLVVDENHPSPLAIIYRSELDFISRCILDYPNIETGGQLFGFWTSDGTPVVTYVIGPGINAQHHQTSFVQDQDYPDVIGRALYRSFRLQHIGEWHSHHQLDLARPSGGDVSAFVYGLRNPKFPRLLLCIGNCTPTETTVNAFNFHKNAPHNYVHAHWDIVESESPYRPLVDHDLHSVLIQPHTRTALHGQLFTVQTAISKASSARNHWLTESVGNVEMMKSFVEDVKNLTPEYSVKTEMLATGEPLINIADGKYEIVLPYGFPQRPPILKGNAVSERTEATIVSQMEQVAETWETNPGSLRNDFRNWLKETLVDCILHERKYDAQTPMDHEHGISPKKPHCWKKLHERMEDEMRVLKDHYNFTSNTLKYHEDEYSNEIDINLVAFNPKEDCHTVIKFVIPTDYPYKMPDVFVGEYNQAVAVKYAPLDSYLSKIDFTPLHTIINKGGQIYEKILNWTSSMSLAKAFFVANLLLLEYDKATMEQYDFKQYIDTLLANEDVFNNLLNKLVDTIKQTNKYGSITT